MHAATGMSCTVLRCALSPHDCAANSIRFDSLNTRRTNDVRSLRTIVDHWRYSRATRPSLHAASPLAPPTSSNQSTRPVDSRVEPLSLQMPDTCYGHESHVSTFSAVKVDAVYTGMSVRRIFTFTSFVGNYNGDAIRIAVGNGFFRPENVFLPLFSFTRPGKGRGRKSRRCLRDRTLPSAQVERMAALRGPKKRCTSETERRPR